LGLPSTPGNAKLAVTLKLDPVLRRGVIAALSATTTTGVAPLTVSFDGSGTQAPAGISSYAFDFNGDGVADQTGPSPTGTFTYTAPGVYTVRLIATDSGGDADAVARTITVLPHAAPGGGHVTPPTLTGSGAPTVSFQGRTFTVSDGQAVACPAGGQACTASVNAKATGAPGKAAAARSSRRVQVQVGHATLTVAAGATMPVRFQLNQAGARLLRKQHRLRITVRVTVRTGSAGTPQTFVKTLTITWSKRHR
jgi:PKD repeat protein